MRKTSLVLMTALAMSAMGSVASAALGTSTSVLLTTNTKMLELTQRYQAAIAAILSNGPAAGANTMVCYVIPSTTLLQLSSALSNAYSLSLATDVVTSPEDKSQLDGMLKNAVQASKTSASSAVPFFQKFGSLSLCQDNNLSQLNRNALRVITEVKAALDQLSN